MTIHEVCQCCSESVNLQSVFVCVCVCGGVGGGGVGGGQFSWTVVLILFDVHFMIIYGIYITFRSLMFLPYVRILRSIYACNILYCCLLVSMLIKCVHNICNKCNAHIHVHRKYVPFYECDSIDAKVNSLAPVRFHAYFHDWWLGRLLWNCPQKNVTGLYGWYIINDSVNGLVLPCQCWPRSMSPYGVTRPQWANVTL